MYGYSHRSRIACIGLPLACRTALKATLVGGRPPTSTAALARVYAAHTRRQQRSLLASLIGCTRSCQAARIAEAVLRHAVAPGRHGATQLAALPHNPAFRQRDPLVSRLDGNVPVTTSNLSDKPGNHVVVRIACVLTSAHGFLLVLRAPTRWDRSPDQSLQSGRMAERKADPESRGLHTHTHKHPVRNVPGHQVKVGIASCFCSYKGRNILERRVSLAAAPSGYCLAAIQSEHRKSDSRVT